MTTETANLYIHRSRTCECISRRVANFSRFEIGAVVQGNGVTGLGEFCLKAITQHCSCAIDGLLCWLTNQNERPPPAIFHLGEHLCRAQHRCHMYVVAASMHHAHFLTRVVFSLNLTCVRQVSFLINWQRIQLSAHEHRWASAIFHYCNYAIAAPIRMLVSPEVLRDRVAQCS